MNKTLLLISLLGLISFAYSQAANETPFCVKDKTWGWFFDGQKCERCYNDWCTCNTYNGCTACAEGYVMAKDKAGVAMCVKCQGEGTLSCCMESATSTQWGDGWATRSESCMSTHYMFTSTLGNAGICVKRNGCTEYNEHGLCKKCMDGYFLGYKNAAGVPECQACDTTLTGCWKCGGPGQCSMCAPGYRFKMTTSDTSSKPSECEACDDGCTCGNKADSKCDACREDAGYFKDGDSPVKCTKCSTKFTNSVTCSPTKVITCDAGFIPDAPDNLKCVEVATNCVAGKSVWMKDKTKVSCNECMPHYYPKTADGITTCEECTVANNWERCTGAEGKTLIQCGKDSSTKTGKEAYTTAVPHTSQNYLVKIKDGTSTKMECVPNDNSCMWIKENVEGE